jgi:hypothetical protein
MWTPARAALACLLVAASQARADEQAYEVTGEGWKGVVVVSAAHRGGTVRFTRRFDAGERAIEVYAGTVDQGRNAAGGGLQVRASVAPVAGVATAVETLGTSSEARPMRLVLMVRASTTWTVELRDPDDRVVASGAGHVASAPRLDAPASAWKRFEGVPFVQGEGDPTDIHTSDPTQGQLGDCYLIAGMISLAGAEKGRDALRAMIREVEPGKWVVTLRGEGQFLIDGKERNDEKVDPRLHYTTRVTVDDHLPVGPGGFLVFAQQADTRTDGGRTIHELWPNLIERAYAQSAGSYAAIRGGWSGDVFRIAGGTVARHKTATMTDAEIDRVLREAAAAGHAVAISSSPQTGAVGPAVNVVADHAYAFMGGRDGGWLLRNPWGSSHPSRPLTAADLRGMACTIEVCAIP